MTFVTYSTEQRNARTLLSETNDCTVMAWSNLFDASYEKSHAFLAKHGRVRRRGMTKSSILKAFESVKKAKVAKGPYSRDNRITLSAFCKKHPIGRYYVLVFGHALVVKDGVVYDWKHGPRRQVTHATRIYLEGEYVDQAQND